MKHVRVRMLIAVAVSLSLAALFLLVSYYTVIASPTTDAGLGPSPDSPATSAAAREWSSGWVTIPADTCQVFNHNLGISPDNYVVELWFLDTDEGLGMNRANYGGAEFNGDWHGAHWQDLTANTIRVCRQKDDRAADQVHIEVSVALRDPEYDSGWQQINPGQTITFSHNLGVSGTDLTVSLWFRDIPDVPAGDVTSRGIHHFAYGGLAVDGPQKMLGAHWHNLTDNTVQVTRHRDDTDVDQVRVVVVHAVPPHYDSLVAFGGWLPIAPGTEITITHNLNASPEQMLVNGECFSSTLGIHHLAAGGDHYWFSGWQGAHLQNLTASTVRAVRRPEDQICPLFRVRIWVRSTRVYLPLALKN